MSDKEAAAHEPVRPAAEQSRASGEGAAVPARTTYPTGRKSMADVAPNNTGLPGNVLQQMESSFGTGFRDVRITTNSPKAVQLKAQAFTQGNQVHFAPGHYEPQSTAGQELIGHEFAHVVQQKQGRVKPTIQAKSFRINDSESLELEADRAGALAARGQRVPGYATQQQSADSAMSAIQRRPMYYRLSGVDGIVLELSLDQHAGNGWSSTELNTANIEDFMQLLKLYEPRLSVASGLNDNEDYQARQQPVGERAALEEILQDHARSKQSTLYATARADVQYLLENQETKCGFNMRDYMIFCSWLPEYSPLWIEIQEAVYTGWEAQHEIDSESLAEMPQLLPRVNNGAIAGYRNLIGQKGIWGDQPEGDAIARSKGIKIKVFKTNANGRLYLSAQYGANAGNWVVNNDGGAGELSLYHDGRHYMVLKGAAVGDNGHAGSIWQNPEMDGDCLYASLAIIAGNAQIDQAQEDVQQELLALRQIAQQDVSDDQIRLLLIARGFGGSAGKKGSAFQEAWDEVFSTSMAQIIKDFPYKRISKDIEELAARIEYQVEEIKEHLKAKLQPPESASSQAEEAEESQVDQEAVAAIDLKYDAIEATLTGHIDSARKKLDKKAVSQFDASSEDSSKQQSYVKYVQAIYKELAAARKLLASEYAEVFASQLAQSALQPDDIRAVAVGYQAAGMRANSSPGLAQAGKRYNKGFVLFDQGFIDNGFDHCCKWPVAYTGEKADRVVFFPDYVGVGHQAAKPSSRLHSSVRIDFTSLKSGGSDPNAGKNTVSYQNLEQGKVGAQTQVIANITRIPPTYRRVQFQPGNGQQGGWLMYVGDGEGRFHYSWAVFRNTIRTVIEGNGGRGTYVLLWPKKYSSPKGGPPDIEEVEEES